MSLLLLLLVHWLLVSVSLGLLVTHLLPVAWLLHLILLLHLVLVVHLLRGLSVGHSLLLGCHLLLVLHLLHALLLGHGCGLLSLHLLGRLKLHVVLVLLLLHLSLHVVGLQGFELCFLFFELVVRFRPSGVPKTIKAD